MFPHAIERLFIHSVGNTYTTDNRLVLPMFPTTTKMIEKGVGKASEAHVVWERM
ncbi:hypothetical protein PILCRDRAFT_822784 [Piloderma croceum F 1598]|uniref:Uncharacterized protein n=1 Tax=Piloderma croceum (strain F 1598) TaxID=765440 RepID=A0A0C3F6L3_PILCF|nr:hypothetical protein PILCRDRAFT_822784 [Piloderma croceum F 1598]